MSQQIWGSKTQYFLLTQSNKGQFYLKALQLRLLLSLLLLLILLLQLLNHVTGFLNNGICMFQNIRSDSKCLSGFYQIVIQNNLNYHFDVLCITKGVYIKQIIRHITKIWSVVQLNKKYIQAYLMWTLYDKLLKPCQSFLYTCKKYLTIINTLKFLKIKHKISYIVILIIAKTEYIHAADEYTEVMGFSGIHCKHTNSIFQTHCTK